MPSQKNSGNRSFAFAKDAIANNSSMSCCKIMMHLILSEVSTWMSCVDIMTREGNNGQVDNSSTRATGYIIYNEKTGPEFVLPISSPGFPKNGG